MQHPHFDQKTCAIKMRNMRKKTFFLIVLFASFRNSKNVTYKYHSNVEYAAHDNHKIEYVPKVSKIVLNKKFRENKFY
jgi:hypothetical protein